MNQKRKKIIIILSIIIVLILILISGITYAYIGTDLFKSDKKLFFKYISQLNDTEDGFVNEYVKQYFEKKQNTPYENNGTIRFNITSSLDEDQLERTNDTTITYTGKVDKKNSKTSQDIDINYSNDVKFPISYLQSDDVVGLKTEYVGKKFIAMQLNQLDEITEISDDSINKAEELLSNPEKKLSNEDIEYIKNIYFNVLNQELTDNNFSKIEGENVGYKLTLNSEQIKNILIKLLETLQNDNFTLEKINELTSSKITANDIQNEITELNNSTQTADETLEVLVYQQDRKLNKIEFVVDQNKIKIEKIETGNSTEYNLSIEANEDNQTVTAYLNMRYSGLQGLQSIAEDYELGIQLDNENQYIYYWNHNVDFDEGITIEDFTEENSLNLSNYEQSQVSDFMLAVMQRLQEVNTKQMESLGIADSTNPLIYAIPLMSMYSESTNMIGDESLSEVEVQTHNAKFENYESSNLQGVTVKGLLTTIQSNNLNSDDRKYKITEINFNGEEYEVTEQNITLIKSEISVEDSFKVECEKDSDSGIVYRIVINKN